jgi:UDP-glucose:(glucosyl)LPS alpha-1,2-glucosyltransferase
MTPSHTIENGHKMADEVKQENTAPMGGSEIIRDNLRRALPDIFPVFDDPSQDKVQVIVSRPQQVELDTKRPKLLWLQDLPADPNSHCLADPTFRSQFNRIVCVSHWQMQQYSAVLRIPMADMTVIKNAVPRITPTMPKERGEKLKFIYTSTPHRGLAVLAAVAEKLKDERQDWQLDVYSSFNIYGWHDADKQWEPLYDQLRKNPCVNYHGSQSNAIVRQAVQDAHVFVYPSIYMETSCMALQEAMMAGCLAITTNLGALPETGCEFAWIFPIHESAEVIAERTHASMVKALTKYDQPSTQQILELQSMYYQNFYAFENRIPVWEATLNACIAEGSKQEMLIIE